MKRVVITFFAALWCMSSSFGQTKGVAMLEPICKGGNITTMEKEMITAALEETISEIPGFNAFTRLDVNQIMKEQAFQASGMVSDAQRKKIGEMTGAKYICASQLTVGENIMLKASIIDMESGQIINTASKFLERKEEKIYTGCQELGKTLMSKLTGNSSGFSSSSSSNRSSTAQPTKTHPAEPEMVFVKGGTFLMGCTGEQGSDCLSEESPNHSVSVGDFYMAKYEVTQAQWKQLMGTNPSNFKGDNLPVEQVSWEEAQMFIERLNAATGKTYRLPTEAEWEYAARGGAQSKGYKYSGSNFIENVAWYTSNSGSATHPVGSKMANELGIYDMSGNVMEWCSDWYGSYNSAPQNNPLGASSGSYRVFRGGHWNRYALYCRVTDRSSSAPGNRSGYLGFRLVLVP